MERRNFYRIPFTIDAVVHLDSMTAPGRVLNICLGGIYISVTERLPLHARVDVQLLLSSDSARKSLRLSGEIIRHDADGTAVKLMKLDLDSYIRIRDLMMDHTHDPESIMEEFGRFITEHGIN
jgi:hypothetical protein